MVVIAVVVLPFAIVAFGGLGFSFYTQSTRPLQVESLGASILLAADSVGVYDAHMIGGKANSNDLDGQVTIAKVNVDDNPELAQRYHVMSIPTMLVFSGGEISRKLVGAMGKTQLLQELDEFLVSAH